MISLAAAIGLIEAIEETGRDPGKILGAVGLDRQALADPHGFIPAADFARVLEEAARVTGDDCFGLHLGQRYHPKNLGPLAYVVLNSPTIGVGFENVARYLRVHNEAAEVSFVVGQQWDYLRHLLSGVPLEIRRQHTEFGAAVGLGLIRLMAGSGWVPIEVEFEHAEPAQCAEHARVFGAPVSFGRITNGFVVEHEFSARQVPAADERLYPILTDYLDRVLSEMPPEDGLLASVRRAIMESLRHGDPTLTEVAHTLAVGPRTLQRGLRAHGVDFKGLVEDTRRRFALRYLHDLRHTLTEVAYLLGYSEVSAFNRAFKRWTGTTPAEHRRGEQNR